MFEQVAVGGHGFAAELAVVACSPILGEGVAVSGVKGAGTDNGAQVAGVLDVFDPASDAPDSYFVVAELPGRVRCFLALFAVLPASLFHGGLPGLEPVEFLP